MSKERQNSPEQQTHDYAATLSRLEQFIGDDDASFVLQRDAFVAERLKKLESSAVKEKTISMLSNKDKHGFIHPETEVKRVFVFDGFKLDDPEVYKMLLETLRKLKQSPGWDKLALRSVVSTAVQYVIGGYFGNLFSTTNTNERNKTFYTDRSDVNSEPFSIKELQGKGIAVCAEKAALVQNLVSFLGMESRLIMSSSCAIGGEDERDGHAFNIMTTDTGTFIFDPTNPKIAYNEDKKISAVYPALYKLTSEQGKSFEKGEGVEILHQDIGSDQKPLDPVKRIYRK